MKRSERTKKEPVRRCINERRSLYAYIKDETGNSSALASVVRLVEMLNTDLAKLKTIGRMEDWGNGVLHHGFNQENRMTTAALIPYTTLVQQFKSAPPGKLYCLHGSSSVFRLSLYAAAHALLNGIPITLVDGTNRFDVYYIAEFARAVAHQQHNTRRLAPKQLLENIFISRTFTCYQMEATLTERLPAFVKRKHTSIVIIFGLLDTFYDEQAPFFEVNAGVQRIIAALHRLKRENVSILLASRDMKLESTERNALFPKVASAMDRVFSVTESNEGLKIVHEPQKQDRYRIVCTGG
jgi:hypothetical protein